MSLLQQLQQHGVQVTLDDCRLAVDTDVPMTDEQRDFIRDHKAELIEELGRRIPLDMETAWAETIHPLDDAGQAIQKIHWLLGECPEIGLMPSEIADYYGSDLVEIGKLSLEQIYWLIAQL